MDGPREVVSELEQAEDLGGFSDAALANMAETLDLEEREMGFDPEPAAWWACRISAAQERIQAEIVERISAAERKVDRLMAGDRAPW